ncbi:hypothetical protein HDU76_004963 [Blyttiomyces sp. JEL0837]|nr:hypothetical protein HDU76_004963 [Blyttiomyces sp. JEL0837]
MRLPLQIKITGPGKPLDTDRFHIICTNVIGGCYGSTGPSSEDPTSRHPYGTHFPILTVWDMMRAQFRMLDSMGVQKLYACVGSSMGGMQSLAAAAMYPDRVGKLVSISAAARSHPYSIALRYVQRQVLMTDPNWKRGFYYDSIPPHVGMKMARQIGTVTYRSGPEWEIRFGRKRANPDSPPLMCADFLIESYLDHQGEKFCLIYDANSLLYISKAMDLFDMSDAPASTCNQSTIAKPAPTQCNTDFYMEKMPSYNASVMASLENAMSSTTPSGPAPAYTEADMTDRRHRTNLVKGMSCIRMPTLVIGCKSDILFPVWQQREIAECLVEGGNKDVTYVELDAMYGHDTFLIDFENVGAAVKKHLE